MITDFLRDKSEVRIRLTSLFKAGRLLTFSAFRMGAYWRWALIRGWALIRINTVLYRIRSLSNGASISINFLIQPFPE